MIISEHHFFVFFVILVRALGLISMIPMFGGRLVPKQVKIALAAAIALLLFPFLIKESIEMPRHFFLFLLVVVKEVLVGLLMGFVIKVLFYIVDFGANIIASETSLMRSDVFDPLAQVSTTAVGTLLFNFTGILLLVSGAHYSILEAFLLSFKKVPIGYSFSFLKDVYVLTQVCGEIFLLGLKIAAPILALSFVINMVFSILGKTVPKMNVFMISFPVKILSGLSLLLFIIGLIALYINQYAYSIPKKMLEVLSF